jgi:hypothetical protein
MEELRNGGTTNGVTCAGLPSWYTIDTLYDAPGYRWTKADILAKLNSNKYNQIHHLGHCANYHLMNMEAHLGMGDLASLVNNNLVFIYSQGCFDGSFDNYFYGTGNYVNYDDIGEKILRNNRYGMAAGVLMSRYGWGESYSTDGPSQWFHREFVDGYAGEFISELGAINAYSHEANTWRLGDTRPSEDGGSYGGYARWCMYESNLFGDPQLLLNVFAKPGLPVLRNYTLSDASGGNGDGIPNPGERVELKPTLISQWPPQASEKR